MTATKLSDFQKANRKAMMEHRKANGWEVHSFPEHRATVAIRRTGSAMGKFTLSIASPDEPKFKRKVGEFHALQRIDDGAVLPVAMVPGDTLEGIAEHLASSLGVPTW